MRKELMPFAVLGGLALSTTAFSWRSKKEIRRRDKHCVLGGCEDLDTHLEAAHINHNRKNKNYDDPSNGRLLCTPHHYLDHKNREGRNGLSKKNNRWAKKTIWRRMTPEEKNFVDNQ